MITRLWGFWGIFGMVVFVVIWAAIITGIVYLVRWLNRPERGICDTNLAAAEILKKRYACGEIGKEEFEERMAELRKASGERKER